MFIKNLKISVVGIGYVGLPLALALSKKRKIICYDNDKKRISELIKRVEINKDVKLNKSNTKNLYFTSESENLMKCNIFIITVPTPVNKNNKPDLRMLMSATKIIAKNLKKNNVVIYESTLYPGCTEEICIPLLEKFSKLKFNEEFFVGYSPERINPGDNEKTIEKIKKIISASNKETLILLRKIYSEVVKAGLFEVKSIKIAESAKVIENIQRDLNIALFNELAIIFEKMNINSKDVFDAASSKWNFLRYEPGLVGGHCIGVDPYYLFYKSAKIGYNPKFLLSGRKINESMPNFIKNQVIKVMKLKKINVVKSRILIMGITFKENCSDIRNSQVFKIADLLYKKNIKIDIFDPWAMNMETKNQKNFKMINTIDKKKYDGVIFAVAHNCFKTISKKNILSYLKNKNFIYDIKNIFPTHYSDLRL